MSQARVGGIIYVKVNGELIPAKGDYSYNPGVPKRSAVVGADGPHGYTEEPQVPFIEGATTDRSGLDLKGLLATDNATITLELANGKVFVLRDAYYAGEGTVTTKEGEIPLRFEGLSGEEL